MRRTIGRKIRRTELSDGPRFTYGPLFYAVIVAVFAIGVFEASSVPVAHAAAPVQLEIKVLHASNNGTVVDPRVKDLVKDLGALKYSSFELKDQATFHLELGATGRMQLPNGAWLTLTPLSFGEDGKLKLDLEVKKLKFKTSVGIGRGGTLAVGGPAYDGGALILAVTRPDQG